MKTASLSFVTLLILFSSARGQSNTERDFVPFRPDMKSEFNTAIDPKKFKGTWVSLQGDVTLKIYQEGADVLVGGDYFPGVANQGDKAKLTIQPYAKWMKKDPALRTINIMYATSHKVGGGGGGVAIAYAPSIDHLIIGTPPYNVFENGQWVGHMGTVASNGIYGKEFKRATKSRLGSTTKLSIELLTSTPQDFQPLDCTYSKTKGGMPVFLSQLSGNAIIKINGEMVTLKLTKAATGKAGSEIHTYTGSDLVVTVKTDANLKKGFIIVKNKQTTVQTAIIGSCAIDVGD